MSGQIRDIFGSNVRRAREAQGISLRRFAMVVGLDKTYLSEVERGMRSPTLDTMDRIARGLGTTVAVLLAAPDDRGDAGRAQGRPVAR